ncbi:hypothetical protein O8I42_01635 [Campylobacter lari]|uniref:hypothetical protein n=2 Tax=Campylobacter lari TaxID=201 RepID=UPI00127CB4EF|nr:hypothetical protein [Campylobacter lari]EAI4827808.1 hypothetical protein [Campylobacter lari]EAK0440200.1 hypothetical protein [Campylobacter lari]EAK0793944.1 hypothetical protein [Campylobacter lari]EAK5584353.1 hypothetical protein [Campylobacter lari]
MEKQLEKLIYNEEKIINLEGRTLSISHSDWYDPFEDDYAPNFFNLLRNYNVGSNFLDGYTSRDFESPEDIENYLDKKDYIWIKIGATIHSGVHLYPYSKKPADSWNGFDSGIAGYLYYKKETVREMFGVKRISSKLIDKVLENMNNFINDLEAYIEGDVYDLFIDGTHERTFVGFVDSYQEMQNCVNSFISCKL